MPPRLRLPGKVRLLLPLSDEVREIERLLCADGVARVRGVALSPLFSGDEVALRQELVRIRSRWMRSRRPRPVSRAGP